MLRAALPRLADTTFFASENLLCSYTAIALGRVPAQHWFRLGRRSVRTDTGSVLLSWSGTVFESLMPLLFLEAGAARWPGPPPMR